MKLTTAQSFVLGELHKAGEKGLNSDTRIKIAVRTLVILHEHGFAHVVLVYMRDPGRPEKPEWFTGLWRAHITDKGIQYREKKSDERSTST